MQTPKLARVLFSIGGIQILILLVNLCKSKILSWWLGPDGFGVISTIDQIVVSAVQIGGLSLPATALKFLATAHSQGSEAFQKAYDGFLKLLLLLSLLAIAVAFLSQESGLFGQDLAPYRTYIRLAILAVPSVMLNIFFMHTLAAAQRPASSALLNLFFGLSSASAAVAGLLLYGISGMYSASAFTAICVTAGCIYYLRRALGLRPAVRGTSILAPIRQHPDLVRHAVQLYFAISTYSLTMLSTRYFVLSHLGETQAGWLQASLGIALSLGAVMGPMNILYLTPLVNREISAASKILAANHFARKAIVIVFLASLPVVLFPQFFTTVFYTPRFHPVAVTLFLFIVWQFLVQVVGIYQQTLIGLQDVLYYSATTCLGYGLTAILAPLLIPGTGLWGAAFSLGAGAIFMGIATEFRLRMKHAAGIPAPVILLFGYCLAGVLLPGWLPGGAVEGSASGLALRAAYTLAVLSGLWMLMDDEDRRFVARVAAGPGRR